MIHFSENEEESEDDGEEEDSEDEDDEDVEDEELEDEDDELEDDEQSYEDEEESQFTAGINLGLQTSPGLDDTVDSGNLNGGARFRGGNNSGSSRFISSTPTPAVKSTSAYFNSPHPPDSSLRGTPTNRPAFSLNSPLRRHVAGNSHAYGSLGEALASLPKAGHRTNPGLSHSSNSWSNIPSSTSNSHHLSHPSTNSHNYVPTHSGANTSDITTQVSRSSNQNVNAQNTSITRPYNNNRAKYCTSQNISKLIIVVAGIFFLVLSYKYTTLRPSIDIERLVCLDESRTKDIKSVDHHACVPKEIETEVTNITRDLVRILETKSVEVLCNQNSEMSKNNNTLSVADILQIFNEEKLTNDPKMPNEKPEGNENEYDLKSNGFDNHHSIELDEDYDDNYEPSYQKTIQNKETLSHQPQLDPKLKKNIQLILSLIQENPQWGIRIACDSELPCTKTNVRKERLNQEEDDDDQEKDEIGFNFDNTYLSLTNPPINWECWFRIRASSTYKIVLSLLIKLAYLSIIIILAYGVYRLYCWRQEKKIREEQDIFELVEQVLSMLVAQHQQYHALAAAANVSVSQGSGSSNLNTKPCLAVNHIRDQLIPPTVSIFSL